MKRFLCITMALLCLCFAAGCYGNKRIVNDPETGQITPDSLEYRYTDGKYTTYTDYYDNEGYAAALELTVKEGIITGIQFDIFNTKLKRYTHTTDENLKESAEALRTEIKTLNTHVMQHQDTSELSSASPYGSLYVLLAKQAVKNAAAGEGGAISVSVKREYIASMEESDENRDTIVISQLTAVFSKENIISFSFRQSLGGKKLQDWPALYTQPNEQGEQSYSYLQINTLLNSLPLEGEGLHKSSPIEGGDALTNVYNHLADIITERHKPFEANYSSLFSNL